MYPYCANRGRCHDLSYATRFHIQDGRRIDKNIDPDTTDIIHQKVDIQPICATLPLYPSFFEHKGEQVYKGPEKHEIETKRPKDLLLHAVLIVGHGVEDNTRYFLIKNSWGDGWGHKGYAKVACKLFTEFCYPIGADNLSL